MTTTDTAPVTQADREAAMALLDAQRHGKNSDQFRTEMLSGKRDGGHAIQAFACHRLATESRIAAIEVEAAARAMCDRVNGIGDYDENIEQRRSGWTAQARAGLEAAALARPRPAVDREAVARIINPDSMKPLEILQDEWRRWAEIEMFRGPPEIIDKLAQDEFDNLAGRRHRALKKADAILALSPPAAKVDRVQCLTPGCRYSIEIKANYAHSSYGNARVGVTVLFPEWRGLKVKTRDQLKYVEQILHKHMEVAVAEIGQYDLSIGGDMAKGWPAAQGDAS